MRWNASFLALLLPLAGCGGGWGFQDNAPAAEYPAAPQQQQAPASAYDRPATPYEPPSDSYERPAERYDRPGTSYDRPGASNAAPSPAPSYSAQAYTPPQQSYSPPPQGWEDPAAGAAGPRGSSQPGGGEERYDEVGYAGMRGVQGGDASGGAIVAVHRSLPAGTFLEVTSLDSARTILVLITGTAATGGNVIDLSPGAVRLLGGNGGPMPVRVRKVVATPPDQVALRSGRPASERPDTPPVLLGALRKHLPAASGAPVYEEQPAPSYAQPGPSYAQPAYRPQAPAARPAPGQGSGYIVQVAALSNNARAQSIAASLGGFVRAGGGFFRIQLGPFASAREAEAARAQAARSGYGEARVFTQ